MLTELEQTLRTRYELVANRVASLKKELAIYEPEAEELLKLISYYSNRGEDPIEIERAKIFSTPATISAPAPAPTTTDKRHYSNLKLSTQESVLLDVFTANNNKTMTATEVFEAFNILSPAPVSRTTVTRILARACKAGIVETRYEGKTYFYTPTV